MADECEDAEESDDGERDGIGAQVSGGNCCEELDHDDAAGRGRSGVGDDEETQMTAVIKV